MSILDRFSEDQLNELEQLLLERSKTEARKRVDYNNMTDMQRWEVNKTLTPATHYHEHVEYPKTIYAMKEEKLFWVTVKDKASDEKMRADYPYKWGNSPLDFGFETAPSNGLGVTPMELVLTPQAKDWEDKGMKPEAFGQAAAAQIEKRGPGRPKKVA